VLIDAALKGFFESVELLLENGADKDATNEVRGLFSSVSS
jgi:hypothetical protein